MRCYSCRVEINVWIEKDKYVNEKRNRKYETWEKSFQKWRIKGHGEEDAGDIVCFLFLKVKI